MESTAENDVKPDVSHLKNASSHLTMIRPSRDELVKKFQSTLSGYPFTSEDVLALYEAALDTQDSMLAELASLQDRLGIIEYVGTHGIIAYAVLMKLQALNAENAQLLDQVRELRSRARKEKDAADALRVVQRQQEERLKDTQSLLDAQEGQNRLLEQKVADLQSQRAADEERHARLSETTNGARHFEGASTLQRDQNRSSEGRRASRRPYHEDERERSRRFEDRQVRHQPSSPRRSQGSVSSVRNDLDDTSASRQASREVDRSRGRDAVRAGERFEREDRDRREPADPARRPSRSRSPTHRRENDARHKDRRRERSGSHSSSSTRRQHRRHDSRDTAGRDNDDERDPPEVKAAPAAVETATTARREDSDNLPKANDRKGSNGTSGGAPSRSGLYGRLGLPISGASREGGMSIVGRSQQRNGSQ